MKQIVNIINQVFEIEKKLAAQPAPAIGRHVERIRHELEDMGYRYHSPLHEKWDETRTDCEASITGHLRGKMLITDVIKPIVHRNDGGGVTIIQKGIVVVE